MPSLLSGLAKLERLLQHLLGRICNLDIGLVTARGVDHVGHLFNHVNVRLEDEAVFVRHRVVGVVLFKQWCLALDNALHLNPDEPALSDIA